MHHFYDPQKAETWIPAAQAAVLQGIQPSTIVNRIRSGKLIGKEAPLSPNEFTPENYLVLLEALPLSTPAKILGSKNAGMYQTISGYCFYPGISRQPFYETVLQNVGRN